MILIERYLSISETRAEKNYALSVETARKMLNRSIYEISSVAWKKNREELFVFLSSGSYLYLLGDNYHLSFLYQGLKYSGVFTCRTLL